MRRASLIELVHAGDIGTDRPAITYWIQCYAHERYVAQSVGSALAQTGPALDILISDDASPDQTFAIAAGLARAYAGPHRVSLLRSEANRGMFGHVNEVMPHLQGGFIVWQSSDDVAAPERAARLFEAASAPGLSGAWSNHRRIDDDSRDRGISLPLGQSYSLNLEDYAAGRCFDFTYGGTLGFTRDVFDRFGPLPARGGGLECMFGFRAALLGRMAYLPSPLMDRRRHAGSLTQGIGSRDRADDPLAVHERRLAKRIGIVAHMTEQMERFAGAVPATLAEGLAAQQRNDTEALQALRHFRARLAAAPDPQAAEWRHAARDFDPPALTLAGNCGPGLNLLAYEGRYHAVPQRLGAIEPCGLRNHAYPDVVGAWTLVELEAALAARGTAFELTQSR